MKAVTELKNRPEIGRKQDSKNRLPAGKPHFAGTDLVDVGEGGNGRFWQVKTTVQHT
jgi:hypothetical protein